MALQIENGDATQAERDLRAAEQALREALKRGASDEEIRKLMQDLREAAKRFANEMAKNAEQDSPEDSQEQAQDLDKLMDRMEDAARNGTREDAQAMLDQLQEMFENMRSGREAEESPAERAMRKQIGELDKLLRDQQALRDDTFRSDQRDRGAKAQAGQPAGQQNGQAQPDDGARIRARTIRTPSSKPDQGDGPIPPTPQLEQRQQALRDRLAELQRS